MKPSDIWYPHILSTDQDIAFFMISLPSLWNARFTVDLEDSNFRIFKLSFMKVRKEMFVLEISEA